MTDSQEIPSDCSTDPCKWEVDIKPNKKVKNMINI